MRSIPVFYRPEMAASNDSFSPSAGKPAAVVADWLRHELPIELMTFPAVTAAQIEIAHDPQYVQGVLDGTIENGFGNCSTEVAATLGYTVGSMLAAARHALAGPRRVACSPTSGFHHAHYARAEGFCTFNGLIVTAMQLKARGLAERIGILDFDFHYGNGTAEIIDRLGLSYITHFTAGRDHHGPNDAEPLMRQTTHKLNYRHRGQIDGEPLDIVLFQAGADMHVDDPLGGALSTEEMTQRDRNVFWMAREYGVPLVWNLAGGYKRDAAGTIEPVLALHRNTMRACVDIYLQGQGRRA